MFNKMKPKKQITQSGRLHVRVEYEMDAQFVAEMLDTGFNTFSRVTAIMSGQPDPGPHPENISVKSKQENASEEKSS